MEVGIVDTGEYWNQEFQPEGASEEEFLDEEAKEGMDTPEPDIDSLQDRKGGTCLLATEKYFDCEIIRKKNRLQDSQNKVTVWVRFSGVLIEYYESMILTTMENRVGRTIKVDHTTKL